MGLFDKIFPKKKKQLQAESFFKTFTAYQPTFYTNGGAIYESELVRAAIHARATHISKLNVTTFGAAARPLQNRLRHSPNPWQTWGQFLYRLSTILDVQNTAFIVPVIYEDSFGQERTTGIYPLLPEKCDIISYQGQEYLRYTFRNGETGCLPFSACGIMTKFQYEDDFFGTSNKSLTPTMDLIDLQNQGIAEAVKSSATFRFMAKITNFTKPEDLAKEQERFNANNLRGEGGVLLFPNTYGEIRQIESKPFVVDDKQMATIKASVFEHFGVNEDILQNKAYGDAWAAFYEGAIEAFAVQFSDVVTRMLFSAREITEGNGVMATANRLQYMSNTDKLNVSAQMADRGIMNRDEIRQIWNLPPLPDGQGEAYTIRGEYYLLGDKGKEKQHNEGDEGNAS